MPKTPASDEPLDVARRQLAGMEVYVRRFLRPDDPATRRRDQVDLREIASRVRDAVAPGAMHQRIGLSLDLGPDAIVVEGDAVEIEQALLNVATNAIEAAGERATQELDRPDAEAPRVEIVVATEEGTPAVIVRDNGPEPAKPLDGSIFEPLVTSKADGAGLGLTVARRIAQEHGATIAVSRNAGTTTFAIRFPAAVGSPVDVLTG